MQLPLFFQVIIGISYAAFGMFPFIYSMVVKKWPVDPRIIFFNLFLMISFLSIIKFRRYAWVRKLYSFLMMYFVSTMLLTPMPYTNRLMLLQDSMKQTFDETIAYLNDRTNKAPYYIDNGIDLDAPKYFSWEPVFEPIKISKERITVIYIDYKLESNDPKISLKHEEITPERKLMRSDCILYIPEGCSVPLWLKLNPVLYVICSTAQVFCLDGYFEFLLYNVDVKFFKLRKMISSDPKAYKYSSIDFAKEQAVIIEE